MQCRLTRSKIFACKIRLKMSEKNGISLSSVGVLFMTYVQFRSRQFRLDLSSVKSGLQVRQKLYTAPGLGVLILILHNSFTLRRRKQYFVKFRSTFHTTYFLYPKYVFHTKVIFEGMLHFKIRKGLFKRTSEQNMLFMNQYDSVPEISQDAIIIVLWSLELRDVLGIVWYS